MTDLSEKLSAILETQLRKAAKTSAKGVPVSREWEQTRHPDGTLCWIFSHRSARHNYTKTTQAI